MFDLSKFKKPSKKVAFSAKVSNALDNGAEIKHGGNFLFGNPNDLKYPHLFHFMNGTVGHETHLISSFNATFKDTKMDDGTPVRIIVGIKNKRF